MAVVIVLSIGKPVGILLFSWLAVCSGAAKLPEGISCSMLAAGEVLVDIGFTMSLFIAELALDGRLLETAKIGILTASALCAVVGVALLLWLTTKPAQRESEPNPT